MWWSFILDPIMHFNFKWSHFNHNKAYKGGAIFVSDDNCAEIKYHSQCFLQDYNQSYLLIFANNSAFLGPILYGGLMDRCFTSFYGELGIDHIKHISKYNPTPMSITSDPIRLCLCTRNSR